MEMVKVKQAKSIRDQVCPGQVSPTIVLHIIEALRPVSRVDMQARNSVLTELRAHGVRGGTGAAVTVGMVLVTLPCNASHLEDVVTTPAPIHPSLPLSRWIPSDDGMGWANTGFYIGAGVAVMPGGFFLMFLHETVWDAAGADRPFSGLLAVAAWIVSLLALLALAWFLVTVGTTAPATRAAYAAVAVAVAGTAIAPAVLGTSTVLNGVGFALVTLLVQAAGFVGALVAIGGWRVNEFGKDEVAGNTAQ